MKKLLVTFLCFTVLGLMYASNWNPPKPDPNESADFKRGVIWGYDVHYTFGFERGVNNDFPGFPSEDLYPYHVYNSNTADFQRGFYSVDMIDAIMDGYKDGRKSGNGGGGGNNGNSGLE